MKIAETTPEKTFVLEVTQTELTIIRKSLNLAATVGTSADRPNILGVIRQSEGYAARDLSYAIQAVHSI